MKSFSLSIRKLIITLHLVFIGLLVLHIIFTAIEYNVKIDSYHWTRIFAMFNFDKEKNLPTFFSSVLILLLSVLFLLIGGIEAKEKRYLKNTWKYLSALFLFLAIDEFVAIHELFIHTVPKLLAFEREGIFYFAWIIPYGLGVIFLAIFLKNFFFKLHARVRNFFLLAGFIFLTGALGFEILSGMEHQENKESGFYQFLITIEESLEMIGMMVAIYGALVQILLKESNIQIAFLKE